MIETGEGNWTTAKNGAREVNVRFASIVEVRNNLSGYIARAQRNREPIVVTRYGKPYAIIQPIAGQDVESLEWKGLTAQRLCKAWEAEDDALYDYL